MGKKHSITGLATLAARTAVRNKIPNYDARRKDNLKKILYEKYTCCIDKSDIFGLKNNSNLDKKNRKISSKSRIKSATKQNSQTSSDFSSFLERKYFFGDNSFQNVFVYHTIFNITATKG